MRLGLPAQLDPRLGRPRQHLLAVLLDGGEVHDERRARQGADVGADRGGHVVVRNRGTMRGGLCYRHELQGCVNNFRQQKPMLAHEGTQNSFQNFAPFCMCGSWRLR